MITEHGTVIELRGECALIKTTRDSSCESCLSRHSCITDSETEMIVEADNPIHAQKGDRVLLSIGTETTLKAGVALYLVPLAFFIVGVLVGNTYVTPFFPDYGPDLVAAGTGVLFLFAAFIGLRAYGNAANMEVHRPQVERIL